MHFHNFCHRPFNIIVYMPNNFNLLVELTPLHSAAIQDPRLINHPTSNLDSYPTCLLFTPNTSYTIPVVTQES